jgi:hypothetical protein
MKCFGLLATALLFAACSSRDNIATDPEAGAGDAAPDVRACGTLCPLGFVRGPACTCVPGDAGGADSNTADVSVASDAADAGPGDTGTDGGGGSCNGMACPDGEVCVREQVLGGAIMLPDGGTCASGWHVVGDRCERVPTFRCAAIPAGCTSGITCTCASSLCRSCTMCISASTDLVRCDCLAP